MSSILLTFQDSLLAQQGQLGHLSSYETFLDCLNQSNPDLSSSFVLSSFLTFRDSLITNFLIKSLNSVNNELWWLDLECIIRCCPCLRGKRKTKPPSFEVSDTSQLQQSNSSIPVETLNLDNFSCPQAQQQRIFQMTVWTVTLNY